MQKEFVPYEIALDMKSIGFDEPCICVYNDKNIHSVEQGDNSVLFKTVINSRLPNNFYASPTFSQCFRWFRENYDLHVLIMKENYVYKNIHNNYFHFSISKGVHNDITKQQDLYSDLMDECKQDIPGNYLNNEKLNILIFKKGFAFKTYEEIELECLKKLIEIVKNEK